MSVPAIRWAYAQPVRRSAHKFVLVTMAECVNSDSPVMECWPSYAYLARRTSLDHKTVEAAVYRLREDRYIVDTGRRAGDTGKVVVYRLNDPISGVIQPGPRNTSASGTSAANLPENGVITASNAAPVIPPNTDGNPPKNGSQSPQISGSIPPKTGGRSSNGTSNGSKKEPTSGAAAPSIPGVLDSLIADWLKVRKDKRAGPLTETAIAGLRREAEKAGLTVEDAVRYCCEAAWQNFNAGFYAKREGQTRPAQSKAGRHTGFASTDYTEGLKDGQPVA